jgi:hypothetical protein
MKTAELREWAEYWAKQPDQPEYPRATAVLELLAVLETLLLERKGLRAEVERLTETVKLMETYD